MTDVPDLTPEDVHEILRLIDEAGYREFELETPRFSISFKRTPRTGDGGTADRPQARPGRADGLVDVISPMVGTFFRSPSPGAAPFVDVGSRVDTQTQVCIIEVMKLMNSVVAGARGVVVEICVENGTPVQYGEVLLRVRPDA